MISLGEANHDRAIYSSVRTGIEAVFQRIPNRRSSPASRRTGGKKRRRRRAEEIYNRPRGCPAYLPR